MRIYLYKNIHFFKHLNHDLIIKVVKKPCFSLLILSDVLEALLLILKSEYLEKFWNVYSVFSYLL